MIWNYFKLPIISAWFRPFCMCDAMVKRQFAELGDIRAIRIFYSSLVRPLLEYGFVIWSLFCISVIHRSVKYNNTFYGDIRLFSTSRYMRPNMVRILHVVEFLTQLIALFRISIACPKNPLGKVLKLWSTDLLFLCKCTLNNMENCGLQCSCEYVGKITCSNNSAIKQNNWHIQLIGQTSACVMLATVFEIS